MLPHLNKFKNEVLNALDTTGEFHINVYSSYNIKVFDLVYDSLPDYVKKNTIKTTTGSEFNIAYVS